MGETHPIDGVTPGLSQQEVRDLVGEPQKVFDSPRTSWMYRDNRHWPGYTYVSFDDNGCVTDVQRAVGTVPLTARDWPPR